jgi:hypothetical protein
MIMMHFNRTRELLVKIHKKDTAPPKFEDIGGKKLKKFTKGLTIIRAHQYSYIIKTLT